MVKEIFHGNMDSYFYVDSIAEMLAARPDNGVTAQGMIPQNTSFPVHKIFLVSIFFKMTAQKWLDLQEYLYQQ